jgi:hypothetical protein
VLRYPWGVAIGWALQGALVALGILAPLMFVVGGGFTLLWIYCFIRGRRIDRRPRLHTDRRRTLVSVEETLVIVKPDGVARNLTGEILRRIEAKGYQLVDIRMLQPDRDLLAAHYAEHEGQAVLRAPHAVHGVRPGRRDPRRRQPRASRLPLAGRHDRPDERCARHHPRRPRTRLGPQGAAEPRARVRLARVGRRASSHSGSPSRRASSVSVWASGSRAGLVCRSPR